MQRKPPDSEEIVYGFLASDHEDNVGDDSWRLKELRRLRDQHTALLRESRSKLWSILKIPLTPSIAAAAAMYMLLRKCNIDPSFFYGTIGVNVMWTIVKVSEVLESSEALRESANVTLGKIHIHILGAPEQEELFVSAFLAEDLSMTALLYPPQEDDGDNDIFITFD